MSIVITDLIREQITECWVMAGAGVVFVTLYQLCFFLFRQAKLKIWIQTGMELLFWFIAALITSQFLYYCAYGRLSVHGLAAFTAGALLWKRFFCDIMTSSKNRGRKIKGLRKKYGKKEKEQSV